MAGSSCEHCIFSTWEKQTQTGCLLNRLDKYDNLVIVNDDYNGSYCVTTNNICTAKRNKDWLSKNPNQPELAVRKELYPKVQLIILIEKYNKLWEEFLDSDLSKYSAIDILSFELDKDVVIKLRTATNKPNMFFHTCLPVQDPLVNDIQHHINYRVRSDCQFYFMVDRPDVEYAECLPDKLDYYLNDLCKQLYMTYYEEWECDLAYHCRLIYTPLHFHFGGYGSQRIDDKIHTHFLNEEKYDLYKEIGEVFNATTDTES